MNDSKRELAADSLRGGTSLFVGVGIATIISGIGSILVGRLLGPENYALYSLTLTLPTILFSFTIFGIDAAIVRHIPRLRLQGRLNEAARLLKSGMILRIIIAVFLSLIGYFYSDIFADIIIHRPNLSPLIQFSSVAVLFEALLWISFYSLQSLDRMSWSGLTRTIHAVLKTTISICLILLGFSILGGIIGFVSSYVVSGIVSALVLLWKSTSLKTESRESASLFQMAKQILSFGFPLYMVTIIASLMIQYRLILLASFTSDIEIGNFNAAMNLSTILIGVTAPLLMVLLPAFSKMSVTDKNENWRVVFSAGQKYVSFLVFPCVLIFIIFADSLVPLLYGTAYNSASSYLVWFSPVILVLTVGSGVLETFFIGLGENILTLSFWLIFFVIFLPLGWFLVLNFSIIGLIIAELISRMIAFLYGYWKGKSKFNIRVDSIGLFRVLISAGFAGFLTFILKYFLDFSYLLELLMYIPIYIVLYMTFLPMTKAIHHYDLDLIQNAFSSLKGVRIITNLVIRYEQFLLNWFEHRGAV